MHHLDSGLFNAVYVNTKSLTKPEAHDILHCHERRTESRPQVTCTENLKFRRVALRYVSGERERQTKRYTDMLIAILCTPGEKVITGTCFAEVRLT